MCGNPPEKTAWGSRVPRLRAYEASYKRIRVLLSTVIKRDHTASVIMWVRGCPPSVPWRQRERRTYYGTRIYANRTGRTDLPVARVLRSFACELHHGKDAARSSDARTAGAPPSSGKCSSKSFCAAQVFCWHQPHDARAAGR